MKHTKNLLNVGKENLFYVQTEKLFLVMHSLWSEVKLRWEQRKLGGFEWEVHVWYKTQQGVRGFSMTATCLYSFLYYVQHIVNDRQVWTAARPAGLDRVWSLCCWGKQGCSWVWARICTAAYVSFQLYWCPLRWACALTHTHIISHAGSWTLHIAVCVWILFMCICKCTVFTACRTVLNIMAAM